MIVCALATSGCNYGLRTAVNTGYYSIFELLLLLLLNNPTCVYDHFYSMCDDNMYIITVLRDMIDVRNGLKTCAYYTNNDVEDVINDICLN